MTGRITLEQWEHDYPMSIEDRTDSYRHCQTNIKLGRSFLEQARAKQDYKHENYILETMAIERTLLNRLS